MQKSLIEIIMALRGKRSFAIVHSYGDFDSFASSMILRDLIDSRIILTDKLNSAVHKFADEFKISYSTFSEEEKNHPEILSNNSYLIGLDNSDAALFPSKINRFHVLIDHHERKNYASSNYLFNYPEKTSTAEILLESLDDVLIQKLKKETALAIACAIYTDTYRLQFCNTSSLRNLLRILDFFDLNFQEVKRHCDLDMRFEEKMALINASKRIEYFVINEYVIALSHISAYEGEAASIFLSIGADVSIVIHYDKKHGNKLSARITEKLSEYINLATLLSNLAEKYNSKGGGHKTAAGILCISDQALHALVDELLLHIGSALKKLKQDRITLSGKLDLKSAYQDYRIKSMVQTTRIIKGIK
ncbi:MAG: DHH family phosphoesterase [Candidatus Micrarchaeota archaeon]|nr:DHH family phosphoesterase [Candidatus Micrarchaeota archaeon]